MNECPICHCQLYNSKIIRDGEGKVTGIEITCRNKNFYQPVPGTTIMANDKPCPNYGKVVSVKKI
jgi:hypothetical protein